MLLVTGGTTFLGRAVLRILSTYGYSIRTLLEPSKESPILPTGVSVDVALSSLDDERGVRAALVDVSAVIHLAGTGLDCALDDPESVDAEGTRVLVEAAEEAGVERFIYQSTLGADIASAYPQIRAKAMAENHIRNSSLPYTILRSAVLFGADDSFTTSLAMLMAGSILFFPIPGDGSTVLQPLWVEDLATCIGWSLDEEETKGGTFELGGPEYFTLRQIVTMVMRAASIMRIIIPTRPPYLRGGAWLMERTLRFSPISTNWLDYLAVNRTTDLNTLPRLFGLAPTRMEDRLDHLHEKNWGWELLRRQFSER
ncbi:MAG: NAD(P)H-binding protein [Anaerolineales bacterium]|nr:NAD(P)H-binding protein [Anaerolineales bacterium]